MRNKTFPEALREYNIPLPNELIEETRFTKWGKNNCYWAKKIAPDVIIFGDWSQGISKIWSLPNSPQISSPKKLEEQRKIIQKAQEEAKIKSLNHKLLIAVISFEKFNKCKTNSIEEHPYIKRKMIQPLGSRLDNHLLIIPLYDIHGKLWSLQIIDPEGEKRFLAGGQKKGCFYPIGSLEKANVLYICEGFATGASIYMATGITTIVTFDAGNLEPVTKIVRSFYPKKTIVICADNDQWGKVNIGKEKAETAAKKYNCQIALPHFSPECLNLAYKKGMKPTDFNDLHVLEGLEEVRRQVVL